MLHGIPSTSPGVERVGSTPQGLAPTALLIDTVARTASADVAQVAGTMRPLAEHSVPRSMSADARITRIDIIGALANDAINDESRPRSDAGYRRWSPRPWRM